MPMDINVSVRTALASLVLVLAALLQAPEARAYPSHQIVLDPSALQIRPVVETAVERLVAARFRMRCARESTTSAADQAQYTTPSRIIVPFRATTPPATSASRPPVISKIKDARKDVSLLRLGWSRYARSW